MKQPCDFGKKQNPLCIKLANLCPALKPQSTAKRTTQGQPNLYPNQNTGQHVTSLSPLSPKLSDNPATITCLWADDVSTKIFKSDFTWSTKSASLAGQLNAMTHYRAYFSLFLFLCITDPWRHGYEITNERRAAIMAVTHLRFKMARASDAVFACGTESYWHGVAVRNTRNDLRLTFDECFLSIFHRASCLAEGKQVFSVFRNVLCWRSVVSILTREKEQLAEQTWRFSNFLELWKPINTMKLGQHFSSHNYSAAQFHPPVFFPPFLV